MRFLRTVALWIALLSGIALATACLSLWLPRAVTIPVAVVIACSIIGCLVTGKVWRMGDFTLAKALGMIVLGAAAIAVFLVLAPTLLIIPATGIALITGMVLIWQLMPGILKLFCIILLLVGLTQFLIEAIRKR